MEFIIPWNITVPKGTNLLSAYGDSFKMYPITGFGAVFIFGVSCYDLGHGK